MEIETAQTRHYVLYDHVDQKVYYLSVIPTDTPEFPSIVETKFVGPYINHPPKGDKDGCDVRDHELKIPL